jgi:hypothetical protein
MPMLGELHAGKLKAGMANPPFPSLHHISSRLCRLCTMSECLMDKDYLEQVWTRTLVLGLEVPGQFT